ncbi:hypothetical protein LH464_24040 [Neorhizobium sp. T786]|uniref:bestrophin-like domain n=1 Tax=Pseudorhizobium xiangyangii TaxID=2883104 RepID=UPI001CFF6D29|nr:hypothetical protein [Neorhizobium xiangyangii]MCB5205515.1 hypothetical protein [Neorhizobium xiangyangii]
MSLFSFFLFAFFCSVLWAAGQVGGRLVKKRDAAESMDEFRLILGAVLSLLGLVIGFTLSMSIAGYNSRQAAQEAEASSINSAYLRAGLLEKTYTAPLRTALLQYLKKRVEYYNGQSNGRVSKREEAISVQNELWERTVSAVAGQQTAITSLVVTGVNDVISSQKRAQAGWKNQIPLPAWLLLFVIALCCCVMIGYSVGNVRKRGILLLILPSMISLSFVMVAEIDSPGEGMIRVNGHDLYELHRSLIMVSAN